MRAFLSLAALFSSIFLAHSIDVDEFRAFKNENVGGVTLVAPKNWKPIERHYINFGTTFYWLLPPTKGQFDFEIPVNDLAHMKREALLDKDIELYIQSNWCA